MLSLAVMSLATTAMGLLPTYAQWGPAATVLFVLMRLVQGFRVGGELPGAITYVTEVVPPRRATLACGLVFGCIAGAARPRGSGCRRRCCRLAATLRRATRQSAGKRHEHGACAG